MTPTITGVSLASAQRDAGEPLAGERAGVELVDTRTQAESAGAGRVS